MKLDEKALEAAIVAVESMGCAHFGAEIEAAIRAYLSTATPPDELSGDPGELIDKMAEAIRDWGSHYDDGPWETLPEDRKAGWRGDAERALAVVKEYLTSQAATALRLSAGGCKTERRKFYHHGYSTAELLKARKSPPEFFTDDGEAWRYEYTHSDGEGGAYDMLYRPASPTVEAGQKTWGQWERALQDKERGQ